MTVKTHSKFEFAKGQRVIAWTLSGVLLGTFALGTPAAASTETQDDLTIALETSETLATDEHTTAITLGQSSESGVLVPEELGKDSVELATEFGEVHVSLPVNQDADAVVTEHGDLVAPAKNEGASLIVQEFDATELDGVAAGFRTIITIDSRETDPLFTFPLDLPEGAHVESDDNEGIAVLSENDELITYIGAPWAIDADGQEVPTWYEFEDGTLYQYVDHLSAQFEYPIIADPPFLVPLLLTGGRIIVQRVVAASVSAAGRAAVANLARKGISAVVRNSLLSITQNNYRNNLKIYTKRDPGTRCDAHHTLVKKHRKNYEKAGFKGNDSIDHPKYLVWWEKHDHRSKSKAINNQWDAFFLSFKNPSKSMILNKRTAVLRMYPPFC
ncbi:hypothetical protein ACFSYH_10495 [Populibacterium corticicola]|uniref:Uncharacterized protein n=1 Tax=Populibacterium corticicola TaxID=1812826 RepID=A0ABW5XET7_9MICO